MDKYTFWALTTSLAESEAVQNDTVVNNDVHTHNLTITTTTTITLSTINTSHLSEDKLTVVKETSFTKKNSRK